MQNNLEVILNISYFISKLGLSALFMFVIQRKMDTAANTHSHLFFFFPKRMLNFTD